MSSADFPPPTTPPRRRAGAATSSAGSSIAPPVGTYAAWPQRAGAWLFDSVIATIATVALYAVAIGLLVGGGGRAAAGIILVLAVYLLGPLVAFAFYAWQMCQVGDRNGQTIGKRAVGIRVVRADGLPVGFGTVLMRHAVIGVFYVCTLGIGIIVDYLWPLWDERSQSLHDKLAKTYVVAAYDTAPVPSWGSPATTAALAPPVGRPRQAPASLRDATAVTTRSDPYRVTEPSAEPERWATPSPPATTAVLRSMQAGAKTARPGGGGTGKSPWLLAGFLLLTLVVVGVGFRLVVNRGAQKLSDAITRSSLANANTPSTPDFSASTTTDSTATTTTDTSAATTSTDGSATTNSTTTSPSNGTTYPVLSGVTGYIVVRSGPSLSASKVGTIPANGAVVIDCQSHGDMVTRGQNSTDVWDHIAQPDGYVTDTVIDTGSSGMVASDCGTTNAASGAGNSSTSSSGSVSGSTSGPPNGATTRSCDPNVSADTGTTCGLAENTFKAYAAAIKSGGTDQTVQASGPLTGKTYSLTCSSSSGTVNCTGGQTIYITFPYHAAEIY